MPMIGNPQDPNFQPLESVTLPPPLPVVRPRVWPALVVGIAAIPASVIASVVVMLTVLFAKGQFGEIVESEGFMEWMGAFAATPGGMVTLVLPGQLVLLISAFGAAALSPQPLRRRLGFVRGAMPWGAIALFVVATPFLGFVGGQIMEALFDGGSEQVELIEKMAAGQTGLFAVVAILLLAVLPPVAEESLFRGYVQRRLIEGWSPVWAIAVTAVLFAACHVDPSHFIAVLPLGVWLGVVAWRCGATWPAMLCHAFQNLLFTLASWVSDQGESAEEAAVIPVIPVVMLGLLFLAAVVVLWRRRAAEPASERARP